MSGYLFERLQLALRLLLALQTTTRSTRSTGDPQMYEKAGKRCPKFQQQRDPWRFQMAGSKVRRRGAALDYYLFERLLLALRLLIAPQTTTRSTRSTGDPQMYEKAGKRCPKFQQRRGP